MKLRLPKLHSPFASLYAEARLLPDVRRSLFFILMSNIFGNMYCVICASGTTSMVQLSNFLGAGDFEYGIITGIPLAAALLQLPISSLVNRTQKRRHYLITYALGSRFLWLLFGLVPFIVPADPEWLRLWTIIFLLGISSCGGSFINICWMPILADLMPMSIRGRWFSCRDLINNVISVILGLIVAAILDSVDGPIKYTIVFTMGALFGIIDMGSYIFVQDKPTAPPVKMNMFASMKRVMHDKPFVRFTVFWAAWCFTANMSGMYINRYCMNEMGMSNMSVTIYGTITASLITVFVISHWGRVMDKYGCKVVMLVSGVVAALTQGFFLFMSYGDVWQMFIHNLLGAAFWSASNLAATSMQLSYSPDEGRPSYLAFFSCVTSLAGSFAGILVGGAMLDWMEAIGIPGNVGFDRYKILITVAITLRFFVVMLLVPKMDNDRDATTADFLRDVGHQVRFLPRRVQYTARLITARFRR